MVAKSVVYIGCSQLEDVGKNDVCKQSPCHPLLRRGGQQGRHSAGRDTHVLTIDFVYASETPLRLEDRVMMADSVPFAVSPCPPRVEVTFSHFRLEHSSTGTAAGISITGTKQPMLPAVTQQETFGLDASLLLAAQGFSAQVTEALLDVCLTYSSRVPRSKRDDSITALRH